MHLISEYKNKIEKKEDIANRVETKNNKRLSNVENRKNINYKNG